MKFGGGANVVAVEEEELGFCSSLVLVEARLAWEFEDSEEALMEMKGLDCLRSASGEKSGSLGKLRTPTMAFG